MREKMEDISCTIRIERTDYGFSAYCESFKKIIEGPSALSHGNTPLEAAESAYKALMTRVMKEDELQATAEIDAIWDDLLEIPASHSYLDKMSTQAKADQVAGNLIPGGFDGIGEFSDELENSIKALISMVREGLTEREQQTIAHRLQEAMTIVKIEKYVEETKHA